MLTDGTREIIFDLVELERLKAIEKIQKAIQDLVRHLIDDGDTKLMGEISLLFAQAAVELRKGIGQDWDTIGEQIFDERKDLWEALANM